MKIEFRVFLVLCMLLFAVAPGARAERIIYVDADASAGGDGSDWATALKYLQDALAVADANDEIRLAQGTYVPDRSSADPDGSGDRAATFQISETVAICGGYAGYGEPDPNARDIDAYETILSGDLLGNDSLSSSPEQFGNDPTRTDNSYHVITAEMMFETVSLRGLTIVSGHADSVEDPGPCGGGIYVERCSLTVADCTFKNNYALGGGAAMYCRHLDYMVGGSVDNCVFVGNSAGRGSAIFNDHVDEAGLEVTDCVFTGNVAANRGGAMANRESNLNIEKCVFANNSAAAEGGAILNDHGDVRLTNCIISGNSTDGNGGGISSEHLRVWLTNCTVVGNQAGEKGGGLFEYFDADRRITNCIFWNNVAYEGPQMAIGGEVNVFIRHSCFQGGELDIYHSGIGSVYWADGNNTDADPMFADSGHWDVGVWVNGDYHLKSQAGRWEPDKGRWKTDEVTSSCIDTGDQNSGWTAELWPHGKRVNMGAFGGTPEASMSLSTMGNVADVDHSSKVDYIDMKSLTEKWLGQQVLLPEDLNRDAIVDFLDFAEFVEEWFWEEK